MFPSLVDGAAEVVACDPDGLTDAELGPAAVELTRVINQLDAARARLAAAMETRKTHRADGAKTAAAWLAYRTHMPSGETRRWVRHGRAVRQMPETAVAWLDGRIGDAHVGVLCRARTGRDEQFDEAEGTLAGVAVEHRFFEFCRAVAYWCQAADPDRADEEAEAQRARRRVHLSQTLEDMWAGDLLLDPISGAIVSGELARLEQQLFKADWAEATDRLGREPTIDELARTPAQRRADALVEMATRSKTAPKNGRRPAPLFTVLVGYETFAGRICELANGQVIAPGALLPWLTDAYVERVVFDGPSRVIDVSWWQRLFTGATRRSVQVRDRWCYHPTCELPAEACQVDHIQPYDAGGPTTQANGRAACGFHNRNRPRAQPPPDRQRKQRRKNPTPRRHNAGNNSSTDDPDPPHPD